MGKYPYWQYVKWNKERLENQGPFKKMKDRDMKDVVVVFKRSSLIQNEYSYYYKEIKQPSDKITLNYIANLAGRRGVTKEWTYHGYGGYVPYLTLDEKEFNNMKSEVERLGGTVTLILSEGK